MGFRVKGLLEGAGDTDKKSRDGDGDHGADQVELKSEAEDFQLDNLVFWHLKDLPPNS